MSPQPKKPAVVDELSARVRERLLTSVTLTTDRLQDAVDDAVRRGRMTRKDAEELLATLLSAGRTQTDQLLADLETVLGGGSAVRRVAERARRAAGVRPARATAAPARRPAVRRPAVARPAARRPAARRPAARRSVARRPAARRPAARRPAARRPAARRPAARRPAARRPAARRSAAR